MAKATFGAGCFWGVEELFRKIPGVKSTSVGYTGGTTENPTYEDVCTDKTGHAEVVDIDFDPSEVSFQDLLKIFFENHNPTTLNRQGPDKGTQYRSAIFYHSEEQKQQAEQMKKELDQSGKFSKPIVTEITAAKPYYPAEEYHQKYLQKRGKDSCHI
ncbi:peptide-methionine (S)-S-oxide reductase MsrA [Shimazuella sp. AN120528]|uniref:peptide-methionine (S)-S-oxide reductase MsrA n=1 Tax=Shimazuella soli TaxID=1892854 RepID=UPI001F10F5E2|nr:peptide-methionine (S)-S-oxide reductase MsrA [Shimazuella soli]MCH5583907.1 peptide-methionine (S)-S-oxide reductase MsrA [Shimazuella soli]